VKEAEPNQFLSRIAFESARYFVWFVSKIAWRIEFRGTENIPQKSDGGLLVVANHQTYLDPAWITLPVRRKFRYMAWDKAFDWFLIGKIIRYLGAFPVKTTDSPVKLDAMKKALKVLREGSTLMIFPEAEREFADARLLPFKPGAVRIAMEAGVPILPVTVRGGNRVWAQGMKYPRFGKIEIIYHPLFTVSKPAKKADIDSHVEKITAELVGIVEAGLAE
jgi:1-acyl-sn-glycerol-3-phosphate acyltransferase